MPDVTGKHPRVPADKCCLSCYHDNAYGGFNFGVQVNVSRAVAILQELMDDAEMVVAVEELRAWLHSFDPDSLVQLD